MNSIIPSILQSIHPFHCENIAIGRKGYEVRKTKPSISTPFKAYIYCTIPKGKEKGILLDPFHPNQPRIEKYLLKCRNLIGKEGTIFQDTIDLCGKVMGEYICDEIQEWVFDNETNSYDISDDDLALTCLTQEQLWEYGMGKTLYGYHITNLKIYDEPKELSEFYHYCGEEPNCKDCPFFYVESNEDVGTYEECQSKEEGWKPLTRPPQSWCYVEEV